jgi:hypothetical protein
MIRLTLTILFLTAVVASAQTLTVDQLLQSPRQFEGRRVTVSGYYFSDWEGHELYADLKAAKAHDWSRSIWISSAHANIESPIRKAQISGVFFYSPHYHPKRIFSGYGLFRAFPAQLVNCTVRLSKSSP